VKSATGWKKFEEEGEKACFSKSRTTPEDTNGCGDKRMESRKGRKRAKGKLTGGQKGKILFKKVGEDSG